MFVKSDLYIRGAESQRTAIVKMVMTIAERIGAETIDESALNIPNATSQFFNILNSATLLQI